MKVGLIQQTFKGDKKLTVKYTLSQIKKLKKDDVDLIVLQELHQNHYFCINQDLKCFNFAQTYEEDLEFWSKVAKENSIVLVVSLFEKRSEGIYHNTAVVYERDGSICGKYRKMHIPDDPGFYEKFYFTPGDLGFTPIETSVGKLGVLICWDQWFPEAARIMSLKGADILIYPTAIGWFDEDKESEKRRQLDAWITVQRGHAISNIIPLIAVNRVGFEKDETNAISGIRFWGNSFVVDGQGDFLFRATDEESSSVVTINLKKSHELRKIWPFFRDRRVDYYKEIKKIFID